jgi:hypothetical protein
MRPTSIHSRLHNEIKNIYVLIGGKSKWQVEVRTVRLVKSPYTKREVDEFALILDILEEVRKRGHPLSHDVIVKLGILKTYDLRETLMVCLSELREVGLSKKDVEDIDREMRRRYGL